MNHSDSNIDALGSGATGRDIFDILRRQRLKIVLSFLFVLIITIIVSIIIPTEYRSISTILIQDYEIPKDFVPSTITTYADQQLQVINQQIMSRTRLVEIIGKFRLYPEYQDKLTTEEIVEEMRKDIKMEFINAEVVDPRTGRPGTATIAFTLSYDGKNPSRVQEVANSLTSLFLEENFKRRTEQAKNVSSFFENEKEDYQKRLALIDENISKLKEVNFDKLPETTNITMQSIDRLDRELSNYNNSIKTLYDRKAYLEGQLAILTSQSGTALSDNERLNNMRMDLLNLQTKYSEQFPDVLKIKESIRVLEETIQNKQLYSEKKLELELLKKKYEASNQETLKNDIARLEEEIKTLKETGIIEDRMIDKENTPSYLTLKTQIMQVNIEIAGVEREKNMIKDKLAAYQRKLEGMPKIEQEYMSLIRDRGNIEAKFREIENKLMQAKLSENVEKTQKGGTFVILDPPMLPEEPYKPNRLAIFIIGFVLAVGTSTGIGFLSDMLANTINSRGEISANFKNLRLLAEIPVIVTPKDIKIKRKKIIAVSIFTLVLFIIAFILFHIFVMPLDILWLKVIRKIEKFTVVILN